MKEAALYILALCPLGVPGDPELSVDLCRAAYEAVPGFEVLVSRVCYPKSKC